VLRTSPEGDERILTMTNVADKKVELEISLSDIGIEANHWVDLINEREYDTSSGKLSVNLAPYDVVWMKEDRISS